MSCLYNLQEQIVYDFAFVSHLDERACALKHFKHLSPGDIVIFDHSYFSYYMFYKVLELKLNAVFRLQNGSAYAKVDEFWKSEKMEEIIEYSPSAPVKSELKNRKTSPSKCEKNNFQKLPAYRRSPFREFNFLAKRINQYMVG